MLADLNFQEISGQYKNFTRMSAMDFEYLMNLIGPKVEKKVHVLEKQSMCRKG
jgi:hypothetical protein